MTEPLPIDILMVEDNPDDTELMIRALHKQNLSPRIQAFNNGIDALDFIFSRGAYQGRSKNLTPRVILLDLKLPKVNGLDVLREIKSDERTKSIPVVIVTSSREDSDIQSAYSLGANSYIVKSVAFDKFSRTMARLGEYWLLDNELLEDRRKR